MAGDGRFRFMHLGVAVPDLSRALDDYQKLFGYRLVAGPFDDPVQRVKVCFIGSSVEGDPAIELIAPLGEGSPIVRLLAAGGGAYHICYGVQDIETSVAEMRSEGCVVVRQPVSATAFGGRRIAWLYTPSRQLVELVERE